MVASSDGSGVLAAAGRRTSTERYFFTLAKHFFPICDGNFPNQAIEKLFQFDLCYKKEILVDPSIYFSKGQLISKCPFEKSVSCKIPMKIFLDFCPEFFM